MTNEGIGLIEYLRRYGLNNAMFRKLHPAGISIQEYLQHCLVTEYFEPDSDDEITKLRMIFLRVTIRADKCALPMNDNEIDSLLEAAIRGFPSSGDGHMSGGNGGYLRCNASLH